MSGSQIVNVYIASVFVLNHCMSTRDSRIFLENVHYVWLTAYNIKSLRMQLNFFKDLSFFHNLQVIVSQRLRRPKWLNIVLP